MRGTQDFISLELLGLPVIFSDHSLSIRIQHTSRGKSEEQLLFYHILSILFSFLSFFLYNSSVKGTHNSNDGTFLSPFSSIMMLGLLCCSLWSVFSIVIFMDCSLYCSLFTHGGGHFLVFHCTLQREGGT